MSLKEYRDEIDRINRNIAELVVERMDIVQQLGKHKKENGMEVTDQEREKEVKNQFADVFSENSIPSHKGRELAEVIIDMAVENQEEVREE